MRALALFVSSLAAVPAATVLAAASDGSVPFRLHDSSDIVVPVSVGDRGPLRFLLDTGSSRTAVSSRVAAGLGLRWCGETVVMTPAGRRTRPLVQAAIGFGGSRHEVTAMVLPPDDLDRTLDGLLGTDVLVGRRFTIDYLTRRVLFDLPATREPAAALPLFHGPAGFVVSIPMRHETLPLRMIPDTGARSVVLVAREGRPLPDIRPLTAAPLRSLGRLKVGRTVVLERLPIGGIAVPEQTAILVSGPDIDPRLEDGLLPLHGFGRVTFDSAGGVLRVERR